MITVLLCVGAYFVGPLGLAVLIGRAIKLGAGADSLNDYWVDDAPLTRP